MAYPQWVLDLVVNKPCHHCRSRYTIAQITTIGIYMKKDFKGEIGGPGAFVGCYCPKCTRSRYFYRQVNRRELYGAIFELYRRAGEPKEWLESVGQQNAPEHGMSPFRKQKRFKKVQPSNEKCPEGRIIAGEVARFKRQWKRISFRRNTKSFKRFMREMGIDPEEQP